MIRWVAVFVLTGGLALSLFFSRSAVAEPIRMTRKNSGEFTRLEQRWYCRTTKARLGVLVSGKRIRGTFWHPIKYRRLLRILSKRSPNRAQRLMTAKELCDELGAPSYVLTTNALNGTVMRNPDQERYKAGTQVTLSAIPFDEYSLQGWSGTGLQDDIARGDSITITMDSDKTITAQFVLRLECSDGRDNDGDGLIDWEYDLGCYGKEDPTEGGKNNVLDHGWTVFEPSAKTVVVYVSASVGNDAYDGQNPNPAGATSGPKKSLVAAMNAMKEACATRNQVTCTYGCACNGWFMLRRGDVFEDHFGGQYGDPTNPYGQFEFSGLSPEEPMVIAGYGVSDTPPLLTSPTVSPIAVWHNNNIAVLGLDLSTRYRDPTSPEFISPDSTAAGLYFMYNCQNILIEGNRIQFRGGGLIVQQGDATSPRPRNISVRRNIITDSYSVSSHSQGMYVSHVDNLLLEDNLFDHNGWNEHVAGGQATMFNHNIYLSGLDGVTIRNNVFMRSSSMQNKLRSDEPDSPFRNALIEANFYYDGEIGISLGGNAEPVDTVRYKDIIIRDNVFHAIGASNPTGRRIAWGLGLSGTNIQALNNYFLKVAENAENVYALKISKLTGNTVLVSGNKIYNWRAPAFIIDATLEPALLSLTANTIVNDQGFFPLVNYSGDFSNAVLSSNLYYAAVPTAFSVNNADLSYAQWIVLSGEASSTWAAPAFPDPFRDLEGYLVSIGQAGGLRELFAQIRAVTRSTWRDEFTAAPINSYLRSGLLR